MKTFKINGITGKSTIFIDNNLNELKKIIRNRKTVIISYKNVLKYHKLSFSGSEVIEINPGESSKTLKYAEKIYSKLAEYEIDRNGFLIGFGGGVVTDITGFIGSTYLRGIDFGFIPTTLLAMVDAAIGGKNGVNLGLYKNIIGTITQPKFVLCNCEYLNTLPDDEYKWGISEAVKTALIGDKRLFELLENNSVKILKKDKKLINEIVLRAVKVKTDVVNYDERESGLRKILNFGHTFGHSIEKSSNLPHGAAVSIGMAQAVYLSVKKGYLSLKNADRIIKTLSALDLPVEYKINKKKIQNIIQRYKKRRDDKISFILLKEIGKPIIEPIAIKELLRVINDLHKH